MNVIMSAATRAVITIVMSAIMTALIVAVIIPTIITTIVIPEKQVSRKRKVVEKAAIQKVVLMQPHWRITAQKIKKLTILQMQTIMQKEKILKVRKKR